MYWTMQQDLLCIALSLSMQYKDGVLVIRYNNTALVSTGQIKVESVSQEEEDDDDNEFLWWYWLIIGLGGAVIVLAVVFAAFVSFCTLQLDMLCMFWLPGKNMNFGSH